MTSWKASTEFAICLQKPKVTFQQFFTFWFLDYTCIKYGKLQIISLCHLIKHKSLISGECGSKDRFGSQCNNAYIYDNGQT